MTTTKHTPDARLHDLLIFLAAAPRHAWMLDTETLEQLQARTLGVTAGRHDEAARALVATVEQLREQITRVLQARRAVDAEEARAQTAAPRTQAAPPIAGGSRVALPPPPPRPLGPRQATPQDARDEAEIWRIEAGAL